MLKLLNEKFETDLKKGTKYVVITGRILSDNEPACNIEIKSFNKQCKDCKIDIFGHKGSVESVSIDHKDGKRKAEFTLKIRLYD